MAPGATDAGWGRCYRCTKMHIFIVISVSDPSPITVCPYHRFQTKLYVGSALVSVMYVWSSELGLYQTYTSALPFDILVTELALFSD